MAQPPPTATVPLYLDLKGLPGVPRGVSGGVYADVPVAPPGGTLCDAPPDPPLPRDVLHGDPGDVLHGHRGNLLSSQPPRGSVYVDTPEPP